jgi:dimethylglycine dehydrogenase
MKSHYRVVVIGGGVVGASVLYHLAKFGWTDVCLIERNVLTAGSSWHAAGGFHALNADPNIASLQAYTIDLLSEIEKESARIGMHMTGGADAGGHARPLGMAAIGLPRLPVHRHRGCASDDARGGPRAARSCRPTASWAACGPTARAMSTRPARCMPMPGRARNAGRGHRAQPRAGTALETADGWEVVTEKGTILPSTWSTPRASGPSRWGAWRGSNCRSRRSSTIT